MSIATRPLAMLSGKPNATTSNRCRGHALVSRAGYNVPGQPFRRRASPSGIARRRRSADRAAVISGATSARFIDANSSAALGRSLLVLGARGRGSTLSGKSAIVALAERKCTSIAGAESVSARTAAAKTARGRATSRPSTDVAVRCAPNARLHEALVESTSNAAISRAVRAERHTSALPREIIRGVHCTFENAWSLSRPDLRVQSSECSSIHFSPVRPRE